MLRLHAFRTLRDWCFIAEHPAPAPHLTHPEGCAAHPEGCAALRIVLVTVPRISCSCEHFPDGFDLHLLRALRMIEPRQSWTPVPSVESLGRTVQGVVYSYVTRYRARQALLQHPVLTPRVHGTLQGYLAHKKQPSACEEDRV
jgi:hypothetical protein